MIISWFSLLGALLFGLLPARMLINSDCRYFDFEQLRTRLLTKPEDKRKRRRWWKLPLVWVDPVRGYVVATLLIQAFELEGKPDFITRQLPLVLTFVILAGSVFTQTLGRKDEKESFSPGGFMAGLIVGLVPWMVAVPALLIGLTVTMAMNMYAVGYLGAAVFVGGLGFAFGVGKTQSAAYAIVVAAPALISWFRQTKLVTPMRC
ncbi:MAG: hypothetical protein RL376_1371 [Verrucomicrobiota bacterium]|jgi:hypothetical protein